MHKLFLPTHFVSKYQHTSTLKSTKNSKLPLETKANFLIIKHPNPQLSSRGL